MIDNFNFSYRSNAVDFLRTKYRTCDTIILELDINKRRTHVVGLLIISQSATLSY